jgi:hypothetical protein
MSEQSAITVPGFAVPGVASDADDMGKSPQRVGVFSLSIPAPTCVPVVSPVRAAVLVP